ncbi:transcriptional repressor [Rhodobacter sp. NTK016B]|uniref:Fur family transcriptional regulator n=1 Tax=Rhodobacter sp. NTK016B TaxID=2759676 RepID=UPI001A90605C|nr:Fur family transcriptional regulator [Rhodobacter sp. NTK016B]MBN8293342.1 transcriptional repressor [Rhodobacter sp. NTK016B]
MTQTAPSSLALRIKQAGLRLTAPRRVILQVLDSADDHPDVEELHRRAQAIEPGISIATVYRTMNALAEHGLIERQRFDDGRTRYEAVPEEHHDHFIDVETGQVVEFRSDEIERLQQDIARAHGFEIVSHRLDIFVRRKR